MKFWNSVLLAMAFAALTVFFAGCNPASNTTVNITTANKAATAPANTAVNAAPANAAPTVAKVETAPAGDSVGVAECDEYIRKYEACLTTIASKAPQAAPGLKSSFEAQRNAFKTAASTPAGKATLESTCKQAIETAKASTSQWCTW
jgi:hypothetical protein